VDSQLARKPELQDLVARALFPPV